MDLKACIKISRLIFGPQGWDLGLQAKIWAWRLGLGLKAGVWASSLELGPEDWDWRGWTEERKEEKKEKFFPCVKA